MRALILAKDPLPLLNEVYAHIHREEGHQGMMYSPSSFEKSTLISTSTRGG